MLPLQTSASFPHEPAGDPAGAPVANGVAASGRPDPQTAEAESGDSRWYARGTGAYRRVSLALFLAGFATFSLLYCVQPLLPVFAEGFAVSPAESSLSLSLATGLLAFAILIAAALSEGLGRKSLMFGSMTGAAILNIAVGILPGWHMLLALRALEGAALGGVPAVAMAYLAEEIDPRGLGFAMGLYVSGTAFGGMMGRVGTGILADAFGWRPAMAVVGAVGLAAAAGFIALLPPSRNFTPRRGFDLKFHLKAWAGHLRAPGMPLLFAIGFLAMGAFVALYNYAGFRLMAPPYDLDQSELGLIFAVYLFGIAASSIAGALADRVGRRVVLPAGIVTTALGVALTLLPGLAGMILGIIVLTTGFFISHSVASSWVGRLATNTKGHASSLYLLAYYLGSSIVGSAGGWFWAEGGWPPVVAFTLVLLALALLAALRLRRLTRDSG